VCQTRDLYDRKKRGRFARHTQILHSAKRKSASLRMTTLFVDEDFEASAEEELLLVDDALVGADDGAGVPLVGVQVGVGVGEVGGEAEQKSSDHI
jgi:hypothetical protein